jgi:hypothetical protein
LAQAGTPFQEASRWTRLKLNAGIFINHVRRIIEDLDSHFEVLDEII